jgi:hypothetical protein
VAQFDSSYYPGPAPESFDASGGNVLFEGDMSDFDGDTIIGLAYGDEIKFDDVDLSNFSYSYANGMLSFGPSYQLFLPGVQSGQLAASGFNFFGHGFNYHSVSITISSQPADLPDFNADGHGDLLWRNVDGSVSEWQFNGSPLATQPLVDTFDSRADLSWSVVDTFDFNGDGRSDILWRNIDGSFSIWNATSSGFAENSYTDRSVSSDWRIAAVADTNGDNKDDVLWQRSDGAISSWLSTGTGFVENSYFHESPGSAWKVVGAADFDGDSHPDILWRNDDGALSIWSGTSTGFQQNTYFNSTVDNGWHVQALADFNGDGQSDILWRNANGGMTVWVANGRSFYVGFINNSVPTAWHIAGVADFNNDGRADIAWQNDNGSISTWQGDSYAFFVGPVYSGSVDTGWHISGHSYGVI